MPRVSPMTPFLSTLRGTERQAIVCSQLRLASLLHDLWLHKAARRLSQRCALVSSRWHLCKRRSCLGMFRPLGRFAASQREVVGKHRPSQQEFSVQARQSLRGRGQPSECGIAVHSGPGVVTSTSLHNHPNTQRTRAQRCRLSTGGCMPWLSNHSLVGAVVTKPQSFALRARARQLFAINELQPESTPLQKGRNKSAEITQK